MILTLMIDLYTQVVKKQYTENGFTVNYSKAITFEDNGCITPKFDPDDGIVGWERDYDGIYSDDKVILFLETFYFLITDFRKRS